MAVISGVPKSATACGRLMIGNIPEDFELRQRDLGVNPWGADIAVWHPRRDKGTVCPWDLRVPRVLYLGLRLVYKERYSVGKIFIVIG